MLENSAYSRPSTSLVTGFLTPPILKISSKPLHAISSGTTGTTLYLKRLFSSLGQMMQKCCRGLMTTNMTWQACTKIVDYMLVIKSDTSLDDSDADEPTTATPAKYDRRYRRQLSIKLKVNLAEHSLLYIDRLWNSIAKVLFLPPLSALLDCIHKGCITVVLLIPTGVIPRFLQQVPRVSSFFRTNGIKSVCLEKCCIFSDEIAVQQRPNEKVYNCVPQFGLTVHISCF